VVKLIVSRIDQDGLYIEPVLLSLEYDEEGNELPTEVPEDCIADPVPEGFYHPKWDGKAWVEGLTKVQIDEMKNHSIQITPEDQEIKMIKKRLDETENATMVLMDMTLMGGM